MATTLSIKTKITKTGKLTVTVTNLSRGPLGKMIVSMNGQGIRGSVQNCSFIVWEEENATRKQALASGTFTAHSNSETSLDQVARKIESELKTLEEEFQADQSSRAELQRQRQIEFQQRQKRREEQERRAAAAEERRLEREEMSKHLVRNTPKTLGEMGTLKVFPGAPKKLRFRASSQEDSKEEFPSLAPRKLEFPSNSEAVEKLNSIIDETLIAGETKKESVSSSTSSTSSTSSSFKSFETPTKKESANEESCASTSSTAAAAPSAKEEVKSSWDD
jgi:hypothetical protein